LNELRAKYWLWIILFYTILTFILSSIATPPAFLVRKYHLDWWMHGIEYGILAALLMKYFSYRHFIRKETYATVTTMLFCGVVGGLNEALQAFVPFRYPSVADEIANLVGAAVFICLYFAFRPVRAVKNSVENL